jgi:hypothetical protein
LVDDPEEWGFASAHGALLVRPETLAQIFLEQLAGTTLGQIRL